MALSSINVVTCRRLFFEVASSRALCFSSIGKKWFGLFSRAWKISLSITRLNRAHHFDPDIGVFAGISLSTLTAEVFQLKLRATQPFTELVKQAATTATHTWALPTVVIALQEAQDSLQEAGTERYTTTVIPHLQKKIVYKKSAVRYIYNSKFTNRCARPTTTQFQSLSSIRQILSNSTHFTSFDFTTGASILT